jgi:hypothetical protein
MMLHCLLFGAAAAAAAAAAVDVMLQVMSGIWQLRACPAVECAMLCG